MKNIVRNIVKKNIVLSLRFRIIAGVFGILSLLVLLMIFNNVYAIQVIHNQVYDSNKKTLYMYMNQVDASFTDVETYLTGFGYGSPNLPILERPSREIERYVALHQEQQSLNQALPGYSTIDGLFLYSIPGSFYIDAVQTRIASVERKALKEYFVNLLDQDDSIIGQNPGQWFSFYKNDEYYLCRILKIGKTYVGAWANVGNLTAALKKSGFDGEDYVFFSQGDGTPLDPFLVKEEVSINMDDSLQRLTLSGNPFRYLVITQPSEHGPFVLVAMIREKNILEGLDTFEPIIHIVIIGILFVMGLLAITLHRLMVQPLNHLVEAIHALKSGDLDAKIVEKKPCQEFIEVNQAFDDMTSQIKHLKIDVYEEKLLRQKLQLQYLQQQIAPHFFINCLSTIYSLAGTGKNNLVQQISLDLSNHLRYALNKNFTVILEQELIHVRNYLKLCQIRFPNSLIYKISVPEEIQNARIPPLLIQTFVENTVKHEVIAGELTTIYITGEKRITKDRDMIHLTIWDTGEGFSEKMLERLSRDEWEQTEDGKMIGLSNVIQRLQLIWPGKVSICFRNREGAGAQIDICIPFEEQPQGEEI